MSQFDDVINVFVGPYSSQTLEVPKGQIVFIVRDYPYPREVKLSGKEAVDAFTEFKKYIKSRPHPDDRCMDFECRDDNGLVDESKRQRHIESRLKRGEGKEKREQLEKLTQSIFDKVSQLENTQKIQYIAFLQEWIGDNLYL